MKQARHWLVALALITFSRVLIAGQAAELVVAGDPWCPFNCIEATDHQRGYVIDVLDLIAAEYGIHLRYEIMPWNRALLMLSQGQVSIAIGVTDEVQPTYTPTTQSWGTLHQATVTLADKPFVWQGIASLNDKKVLLIKDYGYGEPLMAWASQHGKQIHYLHGESTNKQALAMLMGQRADVFVNSAESVNWHLRVRPDRANFTVQPNGFSNEFFLALSKAMPENALWRDRLDKSLLRLRKNGQLKKILDRYGMRDWVPNR